MRAKERKDKKKKLGCVEYLFLDFGWAFEAECEKARPH